MCKHTTVIALLLFVTTCAFANWTGEIKEPELRTKVDGKTFYLLSTPEELAWFAEQVNSGKTEINAQLSNDIVLWEDSLTSTSKATSWKPIGDSLTKAYNGIFDGKNYKIRGLYIHEEYKITSEERSDSICIGLFGNLGDNGVVKNLNIENAYLNIGFTTYNTSNNELLSKNSTNIGGVIGVSEGLVENVSFKGTFNAAGNLGGLVGRNKGYIEDASFEGCVGFGFGKIGGIVGFNSGSIKNVFSSGKIEPKISSISFYKSYIGGIVGYVENGLVIENCENNVDITDTSYTLDLKRDVYQLYGSNYIGGIAGYVKASTSIINCTNKGTLRSVGLTAGGIAYFASFTIIDNCKNEGVVDGGSGIIRSGESVQILNSVNNAFIFGRAGIAGTLDSNSIIDNCINNGVVNPTRTRIVVSETWAGGIAGGKGLIKNSINNDSIIGSSAYGIGSARVIENCMNNGVISSSSTAMGIGSANLIENCTNNGNVISKYEYFGTNYNHCGSSECYCPEINISNVASGIGRGTNIKNCTNNGNVTAYVQYTPLKLKTVAHICDDKINVYAGGISASASNSNISKSINKGHVNAYSEMLQKAKKTYSDMNCASYIYAGGIVGYASGNIKIIDNYSLADVYATNHLTINPQSCNNGIWLGGVAGLVKGDSTTFIRNVYSIADSVTGYASGGKKIYTYYGALFGQADKGKNKIVQINNVYYDSKIKNLSVPIATIDSADTINVGGLSTADMQSDRFAWILNTAAGTQEHSKMWSRKDGYPIFADDENLPIYKVTFDDDGATNFYRYAYEYSNNKGRVSIPKNQDPADGYQFVSWVKENGDVFDGKQIVSEDMTVSALYALITSSSSSEVISSSSEAVSSSSSEMPYSSSLESSSSTKSISSSSVIVSSSSVIASSSSANSSSSSVASSSSVKRSSSSVVKSSSSSAKSSSSVVTSSSSVAKSSSSVVNSSSSVIKSSSSSKPASSSSAAKSSSSTKASSSSKAKSSSSSVKSSSSKKSDALIVTAVPKFSVVVLGRNLQVANAKVGASYALFDMQGKVLMQDRVASANFNVAVPRSGNYLLKIGNRTQRVTVR